MSWWGPWGLVVTLPCDREAALAALDAAISSAKRSLYLSIAITILIVAVGLGAAAYVSGLMAPGFLGGGLFTLFILVFVGFALLVPVIAYAQAAPWIRYLEELRRGIEDGTVNIDDVCGRPIYWSRPRRYRPGV